MPRILNDGTNVRRTPADTPVDAAVRSVASIRQPTGLSVSDMTVVEVREALADGRLDPETAHAEELEGRGRATVLAMTEG